MVFRSYSCSPFMLRYSSAQTPICSPLLLSLRETCGPLGSSPLVPAEFSSSGNCARFTPPWGDCEGGFPPHILLIFFKVCRATISSSSAEDYNQNHKIWLLRWRYFWVPFKFGLKEFSGRLWGKPFLCQNKNRDVSQSLQMIWRILWTFQQIYHMTRQRLLDC